MKQQDTFLAIDTTSYTQTSVGFVVNGKLKELVEKTGHTKSQQVLPMIEELLRREKKSLRDVREIKVAPGPGSFTGTRVGIAVANTLGWILKVPVNDKHMALPIYEPSKFDE